MCGLPFSGKTTLSKLISKYDKAQRVSFDELWIKLEKSDPNFPQSGGVDGWKYVCTKAEKQIEILLKKGRDVVYDNLNGRKEHRDRIKTIADKCGAQSIVVYLNTSAQEIQKRESENIRIQARHSVQYKNFRNAQEDEYFIIYNPKTPIDSWLQQFIIN